ncbi:MAG: DUF2784 family protein, partial [Candidatus Delongbacteria bacterium]|nr:DUF2784 family protein [Candidatus Delongbacteria bacterium]
TYEGGFIEHYLIPIIYPENLTRNMQIVLGISVLVINIVVYYILISCIKRQKRKKNDLMFYQSIAEVYDYIFPKNRKQLEFIENISTIAKEESILDVGCATGNLSELLAERSDNITGIDLDDDLLSIAKKKQTNGRITYKKVNMLHLKEHFDNNSFEKIVSFGNTLVHLPSRESVAEYFKTVYELLKKNGSFIVQIINYDRIINKNIENLPTIDNEEIKFVRNYKYNKDIDSVDFITKLHIKKDDKVIRNRIPLLALKKDEINKFLIEVGFQNIKFYGGLDGQELTENSVPLLFSCNKKSEK